MMEAFELDISRRHRKPDYCIGRFCTDGIYFCDTLEDPVRELLDKNNDGDYDDPEEGKIYGRTAIPAGRYRVIVTYSPKLKRRLPLILNVPGFTGIRIHHGKNAKWSEGCPCVGENKVKGGLINGQIYEDRLVKLIDDATAAKKETYITIK